MIQQTSCYSPLGPTLVLESVVVPVPVLERLELPGDEAGEGRPHQPVVHHRPLGDAARVQVDVGGRLVHARQTVPQVRRDLREKLGNRQLIINSRLKL